MPAPAVAFAGKFLGAIAPRPPTFLGAIAPRPSGYRHLNRQQIKMIGGGLRVGAVCPPRAPPECFSWFYFACALFPGFWKIWPDCPVSLRLLASPADAGETPTTKKKRALKAPI